MKPLELTESLSQFLWIVVAFVVVLLGAALLQWYVEDDTSFLDTRLEAISTVGGNVDERRYLEIEKLSAEIQKLRSETAGSLFWLKIVALFVTVGGAVGGYLAGQSQSTKKRLEFEKVKEVDTAYHAIVSELADEGRPVLRAAAAVRLGAILENFPKEWDMSDERTVEIVSLTKRILSSTLALENSEAVRKVVTIALYRSADKDLSKLDMSKVVATDAYWAERNLFKTNFFKANLDGTSFRGASLKQAQFREASLNGAVLIDANCDNANFNHADLTGASLESAILKHANLCGANLSGAKLNNAKVHGARVEGVVYSEVPDGVVDISEKGAESELIPIEEWLRSSASFRSDPDEEV